MYVLSERGLFADLSLGLALSIMLEKTTSIFTSRKDDKSIIPQTFAHGTPLIAMSLIACGSVPRTKNNYRNQVIFSIVLKLLSESSSSSAEVLENLACRSTCKLSLGEICRYNDVTNSRMRIDRLSAMQTIGDPRRYVRNRLGRPYKVLLG
jgi:hypothetical protein